MRVRLPRTQRGRQTTLVRLLLGLAQPTSGTMRLLGHELPGGRAAALARVGAIVEEPRFHLHLTGRENLHVHAAARDRGAHPRVLAAAVGLSALLAPAVSAGEL